MGFSVDTLKGNISKSDGLAFANQWVVVLPRIAGTITDSKELSILCRNISMPDKNIMSTPREIGSRHFEVATGWMEGAIQAQFLVLNDWGVKDYFDKWQNAVVRPNSYHTGYYKDYTGRVAVHHLKKGVAFDYDIKTKGLSNMSKLLQQFLPFLPNLNLDVDVNYGGRTTYSIVLENAWPKNIMPITLNNDLDGLIELNVLLEYRQWRRV